VGVLAFQCGGTGSDLDAIAAAYEAKHPKLVARVPGEKKAIQTYEDGQGGVFRVFEACRLCDLALLFSPLVPSLLPSSFVFLLSSPFFRATCMLAFSRVVLFYVDTVVGSSEDPREMSCDSIPPLMPLMSCDVLLRSAHTSLSRR
jgi:hypothetical protein